VVVLCEKMWSKEVMEALREEGAPVQGYYRTRDRQRLEAFLNKPRGVLCTHQDTFSGLECRLLLWIPVGAYGGRSSIPRAVETVAIVSPGAAGGLPRAPAGWTLHMPSVARGMVATPAPPAPSLCVITARRPATTSVDQGRPECSHSQGRPQVCMCHLPALYSQRI